MRPGDVPVGQDDPVAAGGEGLARSQPDSACPARHNHGAHPEDQLLRSKGRSVLVCRADMPVCAEAGEVIEWGYRSPSPPCRPIGVAAREIAPGSAAIMIGGTLSRPTERR